MDKDFSDNGRRKRGDRRRQQSELKLSERRGTASDRRAKANRRAFLRIHKKITTRFQFSQKDILTKWDIIFLHNIGAGGVLFQLNENLETGTSVNFVVTFPDSAEPINCKAKVTRIRKLGLGSLYEIAAYFTDLGMPAFRRINTAAEKFYSNDIRRIQE